MLGKPSKLFDMDKVDDDYKKAFNLGYEIAKELELKVPIFRNLNSENTSSNSINAGISQYLTENGFQVNKSISQSKNLGNTDSKKIGKGGKKDISQGL